MCPEAVARMPSPIRMSPLPATMDCHDGKANQRYTRAKANPSGTRRRVAMRDQLGTSAPQQPSGRRNRFLYRDLEQPFFRLLVMGEGGFALLVAQSNSLGSKRPG